MNAPSAPPGPVKSQPEAEKPRIGFFSAATLRKPAARYGLAAAVVAGLVWAGFAISANRPITVAVVTSAENVPIRVFGLGTVEARVLSKIGFEVGAALVELNADHGDRVTKGCWHYFSLCWPRR